ncbi:MAG TPA: choice-of-anchor J domain-containing protein, partial [Rariglobus sp.]
ISNWLQTPAVTIANGDVLTFYTRKPAPDSYADRLEIRLSTNGTSTDIGAGGTSVGDFTTLVLSINPTLSLGVYPTGWTQYTVTISGLAAPVQGRLAFRYFVTSGGPSGANSDYIGIDTVSYLGTQYWNGATTTADGVIHGGAGTWNNSSTNWTDITGTGDGVWANWHAIFQGAGGTVDVAEAVTFNALDFTSGAYLLEGSGSLVMTGNGAIGVAEGAGATIGAVISGAGSLTKTGAGELILTGANTYGGGTVVQAGVLRQESGAFVDNTAYVINGGTLDLNGGDLTMSSLSGTGGGVALGGATLTVDQAVNTAYAGSLAGGGGFTKNGSGALTLTGTSTINGTVSVGAGTLALEGGTASLDIGDSSPIYVGSASPSAVVVSSGAQLRTGDGEIGVGDEGSVTVTGAGSLWHGNYISVGHPADGHLSILDGGTVSDQKGFLGLFASGTAVVDGTDSLWSSISSLIVGFGAGGDGTLTVRNGGVVQAQQIEMGNDGGSGAIVLEGSAVAGRGTLVANAIIKQGGTATIDADGGLIRATAGGGTFLDGFGVGEVTLGAGGLFVDSNGHDIGFTSPLDGAGGLVKLGSGALTLGAASTYAGGTTVNAGTVLVGADGALGSGAVELADGTRLGSSAGDRVLANPFLIKGDVTFVPVDLGTLALNGAVDLDGSGRTLTFVAASLAEVAFGGVISNDGGGGLVLLSDGGGVGAVTFAGSSSNTYTGATVVGA